MGGACGEDDGELSVTAGPDTGPWRQVACIYRGAADEEDFRIAGMERNRRGKDRDRIERREITEATDSFGTVALLLGPVL